jgi:hypothetical protein
MSYLDLTEDDLIAAQTEIDAPHAKLGQWVSPPHPVSNRSVLPLWQAMMWWEAVSLARGTE